MSLVLELVPGLEKPKHDYQYKRSVETVIKSTYSPQSQRSYDYMGRETASAEFSEKILRHSLPSDASDYHANYMTYLTTAWAEHSPIVFNPDIMWFAVINEIAKAVVKDPDSYRSLFTKSPDKIEILVPVNSSDEPLPIDLIVSELSSLVPIDINLFMPWFSTTTQMARLSHLASFAETCSPYYSYMTFLCNFPKIRIDGTLNDYDLAVGRAVAVYNEFDRINAPLAAWMGKTMLPWLSNIADAVHKNDTKFFQDILTAQRCGSGGEIAVDGWWSRLFVEQPKYERKPANFPTQIARVPWTNADTGRKFSLNCGVFYSIVGNEDFIEPQFGWVQNEIVYSEK